MIFPNLPIEKLCEPGSRGDVFSRIALTWHDGQLVLYASNGRACVRVPVREVKDEELAELRATFIHDPIEAGFALLIDPKTYATVRKSGLASGCPVKIIARDSKEGREWFLESHLFDACYKIKLEAKPRMVEMIEYVLNERAQLKTFMTLGFDVDLAYNVAMAIDGLGEPNEHVIFHVPTNLEGAYKIDGREGAVGLFMPMKNTAEATWLAPAIESAKLVMRTAFVQTEAAVGLARGLLEAFGEAVPEPDRHDADPNRVLHTT